eukprot:g28714.t1
MAPKLKRPSSARSAGGPRTVKSEGGRFGFIKHREGQWQMPLEGLRARSGGYCFDVDTGALTSEKGRPLGRLRVEALQKLPKTTESESSAASSFQICSSEIMEERRQKENAGAFFVLPSQMNAAEYPDCSDKAIVTMVDDYRFDRTAGPRGQLAAHVANAQFLLDNAKSSKEPNGLDALTRMLPALRKLGEILANMEVKNGYLAVFPASLDSAELDQVVTETSTAVSAELSKLRTLAMEDVPAAGLLPSLEGWSTARHRVNLVYASAVPVNAYMNRTESFENALVQRAVASQLLKGAYFGALKLALEAPRSKKKRKVFMLPLGGGVFNNPFKDCSRDIAKAMVDAVTMARQLCPDTKLEDLLDLYVLTWKGKPSEAERFQQLLTDLGQTDIADELLQRRQEMDAVKETLKAVQSREQGGAPIKELTELLEIECKARKNDASVLKERRQSVARTQKAKDLVNKQEAVLQGILQKLVEEDSGFGGGSPTASDGFSRTGSTRFRPKSERLEQWPEGDSTFSRLV